MIDRDEEAQKNFERLTTLVKSQRIEAQEGWDSESAATLRASGTPREFRGVKIVAEGDSWFDYPGNDIADCLDDQGYDVHCIAHAGHLVENIAHAQLCDLIKAINKQKPRFLLLSGGGNDIAGAELAMLVNHRDSRLARTGERLRPGVVRYLFDHVFYDAYKRIIETALQAADQIGLEQFEVVGHGYDYPFADGRAAFWFFGPWLKPALVHRGYEDEGDRRALMVELIDEMNVLQQRLAGEFAEYHTVDLRRTLPHLSDWSNELHPNQRMFGYLSRLISNRLQDLL